MRKKVARAMSIFVYEKNINYKKNAMILDKFFTLKKKEDNIFNEIESEPTTHDLTEPDTPKIESNNYKYSVSYPIEKIYEYIMCDNENLGFCDAMSLSEVTYMEKRVVMINNKLRVLFDKVSLEYQNAILNQETKVQQFRDMCLTSLEKEAVSKLQLLKTHVAKVDKLRADLDNNDDKMQNMVESYKRGFMKGIVEKERGKSTE